MDAPTVELAPGKQRPQSSSSQSASRDGRFAAGTVILGRYRIVSLLGRGGMGEVYRADDLKLNQPVALKFLPESAARPGELLDRLLAEVRLARQISHPNVCRVYDIAESGATHFLSMEYIDGEDLAALVRRIGHLPRDKACQIGRQLCAGLAAAHARGVLHRDLKPSNVMIDGQGNARITDFGLAGLAESIPAGEAGLGTPAYMAPEQIEGQEVSVQSDLWALGLVLYELFTGRKAFETGSARELAALQESGPPTPSSLVEGLDPAVERALMRCLERDPADRPRSALAVAAALPGGDPLAAALAAGETPSPDLVAEARTEGGLAPGTAWSCLALALAGVVLVVALSSRTQISRMVPLPKSTQVLAERAREIVRELGYLEEPADSMSGFSFDREYFDWTADRDRSASRWDALAEARPSPVYFWYRQSPRHLAPFNPFFPPTLNDPPGSLPGMLSVQLDPQGRLARFAAVPPEHDAAAEPAGDPPWEVVFARAELDPESFRSVEPAWTPPVWSDRRAAWEGELPGKPGESIRVESAAYRNRAVWLRVVPEWATPFDPGGGAGSWWTRLGQSIFAAASVLALAGAVLMARRNLRLGRSDRQGAFRFAVYLLSVRLLIWVVGDHHVASSAEINRLFGSLASAFWRFGVMWLFYVAIEPYLRRFWPRVLISWVRLLRGGFRDPVVGTHLLVGCLYGLAGPLIVNLQLLAAGWMGLATPRIDRLGIFSFELLSLTGPRHALSVFLRAHDNQVITVMFGLTLLVVVRLLVRRSSLAIVVWVVLATLLFNPYASEPVLDIAFLLLYFSLAAAVLFRFGLLSLLVGWTLGAVLAALPLTFDFSAWYSYTALLALAVVLGLASWGFYVGLAGRPLFGDELAEGIKPSGRIGGGSG